MVLILILFTIISIAYVDAVDINEGYWIKNKLPRNILRGLIALIYGVINPLYTLVFVFLFWALFDGILNYLRFKSFDKIFYIGKTAKTDIWARNNKRLYFTSKIFSLIFGIYLSTIV